MTIVTSNTAKPNHAGNPSSNASRRHGLGQFLHGCGGIFVASALLLGSLPMAQAQTQGLERFGPIGVHGYPEWYQDKSGLALELMTPKSQAELNAGFDVLLPNNTTLGESVGSTTNPWFLEHFYWLANAQFDMGGQRARLGLALEATFGNGFTVINGDQVVFTRIRFDLPAAPLSGDYLILTPFSQHEVKGVPAGAKIRTVEDIGIAPPPAGFVGALNSKVGPFLTAALTPGGAEIPLTPGPAGDNTQFLADPLRVGPVTGSPLSPARNAVQVFFKASSATAYPVFGTPGVTWGTTDFILYGRVHNQVIASRTTVDRVSKTNLGSTDVRIDVYATAQPTLPVRVPPAAARGKKGVTLKLLLPGSTTGATQTLTADGDYQWTQWTNTLTTANFAALTDVTLIDDNGIAITKKVADGLLLNSAAAQPVLWTPGTKALKIKCVSSTGAMTALALPTVLRPNLLPYAGVTYNGAEILISGVSAPPSEIVVVSPGGGSEVVSVSAESIGGSVTPANRAPLAVADVATTAASTAVVINVLANDSDPDGDVLTITAVTQPASGSVAITGTGKTVTYTPVAGTASASFTYTVADSKGGTAVASVSVTVAAPANRAPLAVADVATTVGTTAVVINVLTNDSDPDGNALTIKAVTQPASGSVTITGTGKTVTYTPVAGTSSAAPRTFSYTVSDGSGGTATANVTVTVKDVVSVTTADYTVRNSQWNIAGTAGFNATVTITAGGTVIATTTADARGAWAAKPTLAIPITTTSVVVTSAQGGTATRAIVRK
jgi:hypothetical protein